MNKIFFKNTIKIVSLLFPILSSTNFYAPHNIHNFFCTFPQLIRAEKNPTWVCSKSCP